MKNKNIIYDIKRGYCENLYYGPFWDGTLPKIPKLKKKYEFMGQKVNSLIGISSCPLTATARYVKLFSRLGYDILTFKSVRSVEWHGNIYPHWRHAKADPIPLDNVVPPTLTANEALTNDKESTQVNSFGIHSMKPEYWQDEYEIAKKNLLPGQILILSLMLTPVKGRTVIEDAIAVSRYGKETSAGIFEINLSCPNTEGGGGLIFDDVLLSIKICSAAKKIIGSKPLLVKVGYYKDQEKLKEFMKNTKGIIAGLSTMNTYTAKVRNKDGEMTFPDRPMAGLSGAAIRNLAFHQTENSMKFKKELGLSKFTVIGIGGVTSPKHFKDYLKMGVSAVQVAAGAYADPYLAYKYKKQNI